MKDQHLKITLPWTNRLLSPNARVHWAVKRKLVEQAKHWAYLAVFEQRKGEHAKPAGKINYRCSFFPPDRRPRDEDNLIASLKSSLDGIAMALNVNDKCFHILEPIVGDAKKPGRVEIDLYWKECEEKD